MFTQSVLRILFLCIMILSAVGCFLLYPAREVSSDMLVGHWVSYRDFRKDMSLSGYLPPTLDLRQDGSFELKNMPTCWADDDTRCSETISYTGTWKMLEVDKGRYTLGLNLNVSNHFSTFAIENRGDLRLTSYAGDPDSNQVISLVKGVQN